MRADFRERFNIVRDFAEVCYEIQNVNLFNHVVLIEVQIFPGCITNIITQGFEIVISRLLTIKKKSVSLKKEIEQHRFSS